MMFENDKYEIPKEVLLMSDKELKEGLKKAYDEMVSHPVKKPKKKLTIKFNFNNKTASV